MFDLISIGDTTVDHFFKILDAHLALNLDKTKRELCIEYGDKIPVEQYFQAIAGNSANVAVGVARLGLKTAIYTHVGNDLAGQMIIRHFKAEQLETRFIKIDSELSSNASSVISFKGERTILIYHQPREYQLPDLEKTKWVYLSSMAENFAKSGIMEQVANYIERTGARLIFNPGTYQLIYGVKKFPRILSLTTLLIINEDEAKRILQIEEGKKAEIKKLLTGLVDLGPRIAVITSGKEGSFGFDGESYYKLEAFPATVVDMTGAGDAYAAGVTGGLIYGKNLDEAMRWGTVNAASQIEAIGAQSGLLAYEKIQNRLGSWAVRTKKIS